MIYDAGSLSNALMFDYAYIILNKQLQQGAERFRVDCPCRSKLCIFL